MALEGQDGVQVQFDKLKTYAEVALALEIMKDDLLSYLAEADGVPRDSNTLANSVQNGVTGGGPQWIIGTNIEYAGYVHEGHLTRPAIKYPERSNGQHWVMGDPFFDRGLDYIEGRLDIYQEKALDVLGVDYD